MTHKCAACEFCDFEVMDVDALGIETPTPVMICRRFPPTIMPLGDLVEHKHGSSTGAGMAFPQVFDDDWCGEFSPRPETETT